MPLHSLLQLLCGLSLQTIVPLRFFLRASRCEPWNKKIRAMRLENIVCPNLLSFICDCNDLLAATDGVA